MTAEELKQREEALIAADYHKSRNTSSTNDYSWFKTIRPDGDNEGWLYMIEWQVWDWTKYIDRDPSIAECPYTMSLCIIVNERGNSPRLEMGDGLSIDSAEKLAYSLYNMINHYDY